MLAAVAVPGHCKKMQMIADMAITGRGIPEFEPDMETITVQLRDNAERNEINPGLFMYFPRLLSL